MDIPHNPITNSEILNNKVILSFSFHAQEDGLRTVAWMFAGNAILLLTYDFLYVLVLIHLIFLMNYK